MARVAHYVTPLRSDRIPGTHAVFDTETKVSKRYGRNAHRWTCGNVAFVQRSFDGSWCSFSQTPFSEPADLWSHIVDGHPRGEQMVVWAHNLPFDMRVSEALRYLPENGYTLEAVVLERTAAWASFDGPAGALLICDLYAWLPVSLTRLAADIGWSRPAFNYNKAEPTELVKRCAEDVRLTAEVVCRLLTYLEKIGSGPFRPTGSGQSHAVWRRHFLKPKQVLVHDDAHALERERTAMWAGRSEAWRHGEVHGPIYELDLNLAYCRIAATEPVPVRLLNRGGSIADALTLSGRAGTALLADVTVTTGIPLVPTGDEDHIYWPVGTFRTTLWWPEIQLLLDNGQKVRIHRYWSYAMAPALAPMAEWIIANLTEGGMAERDPMRRMLKHWARALVGRCALRYRQWEYYGRTDRVGLSLWTNVEAETGEQTELLHVGERIMELADMAEADTSVPQITGWVMSRARVNLWTLIQTAGLANVIYMDTDGLLVNAVGYQSLMRWPRDLAQMILVHKATWSKAEIAGPRNLILEGDRRISGVPTRAVRIGDLEYDGEVWAGIKASLSGRQADNVEVNRRLFKVTGGDRRRLHLPDGQTQPYEVNCETTD